MLDEIALKYKTDKGSQGHGHTKYYEQIFLARREQVKTVLEIGVYRGASLRMWADYFPNAEIFGIDCNPKVAARTKHKVFIGDQEDLIFLQKVIKEINRPIDLIIDDGGHTQDQHIFTFEILWPCVAAGGYYAIEDLQTCWSPRHRSTKGLDSMKYLHNLAEKVAIRYLTKIDIETIKFANKIVFVEKGK